MKKKYIWIVQRDINWGQRGERPYEYLYFSKPISEKTLEKRLKELADKGNGMAKKFYKEGLGYKNHNGNFNTSFYVYRQEIL